MHCCQWGCIKWMDKGKWHICMRASFVCMNMSLDETWGSNFQFKSILKWGIVVVLKYRSTFENQLTNSTLLHLFTPTDSTFQQHSPELKMFVHLPCSCFQYRTCHEPYPFNLSIVVLHFYSFLFLFNPTWKHGNLFPKTVTYLDVFLFILLRFVRVFLYFPRFWFSIESNERQLWSSSITKQQHFSDVTIEIMFATRSQQAFYLSVKKNFLQHSVQMVIAPLHLSIATSTLLHAGGWIHRESSNKKKFNPLKRSLTGHHTIATRTQTHTCHQVIQIGGIEQKS